MVLRISMALLWWDPLRPLKCERMSCEENQNNSQHLQISPMDLDGT